MNNPSLKNKYRTWEARRCFRLQTDGFTIMAYLGSGSLRLGYSGAHYTAVLTATLCQSPNMNLKNIPKRGIIFPNIANNRRLRLSVRVQAQIPIKQCKQR
ncbi:hypothetical protein XELAEV_18035819mg [Xenopus laevis]|uniref:Uncharacterized protein n=1 Tax=Xenopus laevis TaxID=8355 RepID=A0A974CHN1_XENLA|nr:hypothetical protein XELAEV_18035819mg [Xenopus laevis]